MGDINGQTEEPFRVVVAQMPERPTRPLLKDSNRLLALAAFVFSVTTGVYATYQTWKSSTQTTVDTVSKLADQYYDGQGKLSQLNSTQAGYSNFLRTTLRSTALRASALATAANSYIDEGTWLALAQMNDNENNLRASQAAWNEAANKTQDITTYPFATRGLGANLLRQGDGNGAVKAFNRATDTAMSDKFKGAENSLPPAYRNVEAASTQAFWLSLIQTTDCAFISDHFDKALKYIADSHRTANSADPTYENELLTTRQFISYFRKARESCAPKNDQLIVDDDCLAVGEVVDNAPSGFTIFRGPTETSGDNNSDYRSRYFLPAASRCVVDSKSTGFYCYWPEQDEKGTATRANDIIQKLLACKNFPQISKLESPPFENNSRVSTTTRISSAGKADIGVTRTKYKSDNTHAEEWMVRLNVQSQIGR